MRICGNSLIKSYPRVTVPGEDDHLVHKGGNLFRRKKFRILPEKALAGDLHFIHCNGAYESLQHGAFRNPPAQADEAFIEITPQYVASHGPHRVFRKPLPLRRSACKSFSFK